MKYYAIGSASIKVDDSITLEDIKKKAVSQKMISPEDAVNVREITREEFLAPFEDVASLEIPSWQEIVDGLDKGDRKPRRRQNRRRK